MREGLRAGKPAQYFTKPPKQTQPLNLNGTGNKYQPKCGDAMQDCGWGVTAGMVHCTCGWQAKLCDRSLIHAIPERLRDEEPIIKLIITSPFTCVYRHLFVSQTTDYTSAAVVKMVGPFLLCSISVFSCFSLSSSDFGTVRHIKLAARQLSGVRKYGLSYRVVPGGYKP